MKYRLFTPGPVPVPEETLLELARPAFYHRSQEAKTLLLAVTEDLKMVFHTTQPVYSLCCSGTGAMEAAVQNLLAPGDKAILLTAGRWGERWRSLLTAYQAVVVPLEFPPGKAVPPEMLDKMLTAFPETKAVFTTLCETSTGVAHDVESYGRIVAKTPSLLVVDAISALGAVECRMDAWKLDVVLTASQKALMLPPGLAYVSLSDKAWKRLESTPIRSFYFDLRRYRKSLQDGDTPFTPSTALLRAQRTSLKLIRAEGMDAIWRRHLKLAYATRAALTALGMKLFAERPSASLTTAEMLPGVEGSSLLKRLEKNQGVKIADGQDALKGKIIRLAHMGYVDSIDMVGAIAALEQALIESGAKIELGAGVTAFQKAYLGR